MSCEQIVNRQPKHIEIRYQFVLDKVLKTLSAGRLLGHNEWGRFIEEGTGKVIFWTSTTKVGTAEVNGTWKGLLPNMTGHHGTTDFGSWIILVDTYEPCGQLVPVDQSE